MAFLVRAARHRPEDPKKWLFVVKQKIDLQTHDEGIACAVENTGTGGSRNFLLTCKGVTNQQQHLFAHRCRSAFRRPEPVEILNPSEDENFSFTPLVEIPRGCTCLPLKSIKDMREDCRSFIFREGSFSTVHWRYVNKENRYELREKQELALALGSPVLWDTRDPNTRLTYVVGVVCKSADGRLSPKFFTESALLVPVVPVPIKLEKLPSKVKGDSITLTWSQPQDQGEPIQKYTAYQRTHHGDDDAEDGAETQWVKLRTITNITDCKCSVENLERGKKHEFVVTATNSYGEGLKTNGVTVMVLKAVPDPVALKNLPEEVTNDDHITLNWTEPKSNGAPIAHYTPYYRTMTRGSKPAKWAKIKHTTQLLERVEVVRGKINEFVVTATNSCGESDKENIKSVNVLDVPKEVKLDELLKKIDKGNILLEWKEPESNGADIDKYTVYKRLVTFQAQESKWVEVASTRVQKYLIELERGTTYEFCVTATNKCGEGKKGNKFQRVAVLEDVPMPVQLFDVPGKIDRCDILLKWKETSNNGASITKYTVYQRTVNRSGTWENIHSSLAYEYHVRNLERGKLYEFMVTATNKIGEGKEDQKNFKKVKVEEDVPMPVPLVDLPDEINMRNISEVTLKWKKPQDNGAVITKYTVYKRTVNEGYPEMPWEQIHDTDSECYTHVLRLERANTYEFKVTATNRCGEGPRGREITKRVTVLDVPMPVELTDVPERLNSSKIVLKWQQPRNNGAAITGYNVYQRTVEDDSATTDWKFIVFTHELKHSFTLERGRTFDFKVTATNKCGEGIMHMNNSNIKRVEVSEDPLETFGYLFLIILGILALWCLFSAGSRAVELPWSKLHLAATHLYFDE